jgi:hypothetical protein
MCCLENSIYHCCEYFLLNGDDTWWSLVMWCFLFYLIVCKLCGTCIVWNIAYFIVMYDEPVDKLSLHIILFEAMNRLIRKMNG